MSDGFGTSSHHLRELVRNLLAHRGAVTGVHHDPGLGREVYQTSTMAALLDGVYEGEVTIAELLTHGDFGLGTFNHLDGEMAVLEGVCYHLRSDGSVSIARAEERTPFAVVTTFSPDVTRELEGPLSREQVKSFADQLVTTRNLIYAVRLTGHFDWIRTRTVAKQSPPYPPLIEATQDEPISAFDDISGVIVGFRTPDYAQGISVAGYHSHFLDASHRHGGHVLDFILARGRLELSTGSELHLSLPRTEAFMNADLAGRDIHAEIAEAEGGS